MITLDIAVFIIAVIGCVSGVTSLLLKLFEYLRTVPKLKIEVDDITNSYFFDAQSFGKLDRYKTKNCAIVSLKISNCSLHPITINSITAKSKNTDYVCRHDSSLEFSPKDIRLGPNSFTYYPCSSAIKIPARLDANDTIYASARFPFIDKIVENSVDKKSIVLLLSVSTPIKVFHYNVELPEYMHLHDLRRVGLR